MRERGRADAAICPERTIGSSHVHVGSAPMINRVSIVAQAGLLIVAMTSLSAEAQTQKPPEPKGVKVTGLVSSLGGFSATVTTPLLLTGATVELEPGGQTGKQQFRVPTYIYI